MLWLLQNGLSQKRWKKNTFGYTFRANKTLEINCIANLFYKGCTVKGWETCLQWFSNFIFSSSQLFQILKIYDNVLFLSLDNCRISHAGLKLCVCVWTQWLRPISVLWGTTGSHSVSYKCGLTNDSKEWTAHVWHHPLVSEPPYVWSPASSASQLI